MEQERRQQITDQRRLSCESILVDTASENEGLDNIVEGNSIAEPYWPADLCCPLACRTRKPNRHQKHERRLPSQISNRGRRFGLARSHAD